MRENLQNIRQLFDKLLSLSNPDCFLVLQAYFLLAVIRLGLKMLGVKKVFAYLSYWAKSREVSEKLSVYKVIWSITTASAYQPQVKCLARALTAQFLLERYGYSAVLRIGVAKEKAGRFSAHAWVECQGRTAIGGIGNMLRQYTPIPLQDLERLTPINNLAFSE